MTALASPNGRTADFPGDFLDAIADACMARDGRVLPNGEVRFRCADDGHEDRHPSARWNPVKAAWRCDVCKTGGGALDLADRLNVPKPERRAGGNGAGTERRIVATYPYRDAAGSVLFEVVRYEPKAFRQRRPDGRGDYVWTLGGVPDVPYRLPELLDADPRDIVFVTEGEKDADALAALDLVATCNRGGGGKWPVDLNDYFAGRRVVVVPDNDKTGRDHADLVERNLRGVAAEFAVLPLPGLPEKGDVSDFVATVRRFDDDDDLISTRMTDLAERALFAAATGADTDASADSGNSVNCAAGGETDGAPNGSEDSEYSDAEPDADLNTPNSPNVRMAPAFPVAALPPWMQGYAGAAAAAVPVPVEMVAVPMLALTGALIGNRLRLELKPGYSERPSIFAAVVAPPGSAKTAALGYARRPFNALQRAEAKRYADAKRAYDAKVAEWKRAPEDDRGEPSAKPTLRHYQTSDITKEALAAMLADGASPGVAVVRDEVVALIKGFNAYRGGKGGDQEFYMEAWSSVSAPVDRRHADTLFVESPVVAVVGGIQPDLASELHDAANRRNGLVERFLPVVPDVKAARWSEDSVPADLDADACAAVRTLDETLGRLASRVVGDDPGVAVVFAPEAKALWREWYDDNAVSAERAGGLAGGFYRKLAAYVARFALVLHALWNPNQPTRPVSAARMADAIELGEFFRGHIDRLLPLIGATGGGASAGIKPRVLRAIERAKPEERDGEWVPRSAILDRLRTVKAADLTTALDALRDEQRVERRVVETATKSAEQWRLMPFGHSENSVFPGGDGECSESSEYPNGVEAGGIGAGAVAGSSADAVPWEPARLDGFAAGGECRVCAAVTDGGDLCRDCRAESWTA